ncbi:MAG: Bax inhibitor-1/YccA family protein [Candidatus Sericytochromatia bacterium]|nr:Bax inhibitor-1/YccA family protein [Candidatus Sericytochromatia bacterium]
MRNERYLAGSAYGAGWQAGMSQRVFDTRVLPTFGLGLIMTGFVAYMLHGQVSRGLSMIAFLGVFALAMTSDKWITRENHAMNTGLYLLMAAMMGVVMVPLLTWTAAIGGPLLIVQALAVTGITFGSLMAYSLVSKRDFSTWGRFLFIAVIGLIVASIANIFMGGTLMSLAISGIGVVVFSAYVLYNMTMIKTQLTDQDYVLAALMLYINFINLFQNILVIMGIMGSRD